MFGSISLLKSLQMIQLKYLKYLQDVYVLVSYSKGEQRWG